MVVERSQRFTRERPCPICRGYSAAPRRKGRRCYGFLSSDGVYAHCTREEVAGGLARLSSSDTFAHRLVSTCDCGVTHGEFGHRTKQRITATYDYVDEEEQLLFQVLRYTPKSFKQRRPDDKGGWIWNLKGVRRVLYRLPEIIEAIHAGRAIYLTEGEKDADALVKAGEVATCNPGGARKWSPDFSEQLRDAEVVLVQDRDDNGRAHTKVVMATLAGAAKSVRVVESAAGKDAADHLEAEQPVDDFRSVSPEQDGRCTNDGSSKATRLVMMTLAEASLFHSPDGTAYCDVVVGDHRETLLMKSQAFRGWLKKRFFELEGKAPSSQAFADAMGVLEGKALYDGPERSVFVRVGALDDCIVLDLGNENWEGVVITTTGWTIVPKTELRFRRSNGMLPLPRPLRGGSLEELRPFLNVTDDDDFCLCCAWLLSALRGRGPYPIAVVQGEQGSAKSTRARVFRSLVDPSTVPLRRPPSNERDLAVAARNSHVLAFDNLSRLQPWLSDSLCALATGGGFGARALFTNADEALSDAKRPIIINGIDDMTTRPDLPDRSLVFRLQQIRESDRMDEEDFWRRFNESRPRVLGALLDAVSAALRILPSVKMARKPRMADFAKWIVAAEAACPWPAGSFLRAYLGNRSEAIELGLESDSVATAVRELGVSEAIREGTATELLEELTPLVSLITQKSRSWPKTPRSLSDRLRRLAPSLRAVGIDIEFDRREPGTGRRLIRLMACEEESTRGCVTSVTTVKEPENSVVHDASTPRCDTGVTQPDGLTSTDVTRCDEGDGRDDSPGSSS